VYENLVYFRLVAMVYRFEEVAFGTFVFVELQVELSQTEFAVDDVGEFLGGDGGQELLQLHGVRYAADGFEVTVEIEEVAHEANGEHFVAHLAAVGQEREKLSGELGTVGLMAAVEEFGAEEAGLDFPLVVVEAVGHLEHLPVGLGGKGLGTAVVAFAEGVAQRVMIGAVGLARELQERVDRCLFAGTAGDACEEQDKTNYKLGTIHIDKLL
jgi:hypothetical protein